jgi:hypothetical protein
VLRVPRQALENLIGAELRDTANEARAGAADEVASKAVPVTDSTVAEPAVGDERRRGDEFDRVAPTPTTSTRRPRKRHQRRPAPNQATLPFTN